MDRYWVCKWRGECCVTVTDAWLTYLHDIKGLNEQVCPAPNDLSGTRLIFVGRQSRPLEESAQKIESIKQILYFYPQKKGESCFSL